MTEVEIGDDLAARAAEQAEAHGYGSLDEYVEDVLARAVDTRAADPSVYVSGGER